MTITTVTNGINRLLWNLYYAITLQREAGTGFAEAWRCARESTLQYQSGEWPQVAAQYEAGCREVERLLRFKPGGRQA